MEGVKVSVGVSDGVDVGVKVNVGVAVAVSVGVNVNVGVALGVCVGVSDGVIVGVGVGPLSLMVKESITSPCVQAISLVPPPAGPQTNSP